MILISVPRSSRWVAKLWRNECSVTLFLIPAASAASWNRRLNWRGVIGLPGLRPGNSQRSCAGIPASARDAAPTKFWLATVDRNMSFRGLVDLAKLRWRIERDYHDLKQEIGLEHYEGRGWRGFHYHGMLSIAAYGFLISERERIPPQHHVP